MKFSTVLLVATAAVAATLVPAVLANASPLEVALDTPLERSIEIPADLPERSLPDVTFPGPKQARSFGSSHTPTKVRPVHQKSKAKKEKRDLFVWLRVKIHTALVNLKNDLGPLFANIMATVATVKNATTGNLDVNAIILAISNDLTAILELIANLFKALLGITTAPAPSLAPSCSNGPCPTLQDIANVLAEILQGVVMTIDEITSIFQQIPAAQGALSSLLNTLDANTSALVFLLENTLVGLLILVCQILAGLKGVLSTLGLEFVGNIITELGL
jgi:hypothetical protein